MEKYFICDLYNKKIIITQSSVAEIRQFTSYPIIVLDGPYVSWSYALEKGWGKYFFEDSDLTP